MPPPFSRADSTTQTIADASELAALESTPARAICVLGMHRSGTSLVTGLLKICGVDLGPGPKMMKDVSLRYSFFRKCPVLWRRLGWSYPR